MKNFYQKLSVLVLTFLFSFSMSQACNNSEAYINSVAPMGNNHYAISFTFCTGGGYEPGVGYGADQNTGDFGFFIAGGATIVSYPASLQSVQTGAIYSATTMYGDTTLVYYDPLQANWWASIDGNSGSIQSVCTDITIITNGLPTHIEVLGMEGAGLAYGGCYGDDDMFIYPECEFNGTSCPDVFDCNLFTTGLSADKTKVYQGWALEECSTLTATAADGSGDYHFHWSNGGSGSSITVCPSVTTTYSVTIEDHDNACAEVLDITIEVEDVRCGGNYNKVLVCHKGVTKCVRASRAAKLLAKGATLGACANNNFNAATPSNNGTISLDISKVRVSPNPVAEQSTIEFKLDNDENVIIELFNVHGQLVRTLYNDFAAAGNTYQLNFNRTDLSGGMYFLQLRSENRVIKTERMVIQRL